MGYQARKKEPQEQNLSPDEELEELEQQEQDDLEARKKRFRGLNHRERRIETYSVTSKFWSDFAKLNADHNVLYLLYSSFFSGFLYIYEVRIFLLRVLNPT